MPNSSKGLASMSPEKRREIASAGGKAAWANGKANKFTPDSAAAAGRKGGASRRRMILSATCLICEQVIPPQEATIHPCFQEVT